MLRQTEEVNLLIRVIECSLQSDGWPAILSFIDAKLDCRSFLAEFDQSGQPTSRFGGERPACVLRDVLRQIRTEGGRDALHFLLSEASLFYPYCKTSLDRTPQRSSGTAPEPGLSAGPLPEDRQLFDSLLAARGILSPVWRTETSTILFGCLFTGSGSATIDDTVASETFRKLVHAVTPGLSAFFQHDAVLRHNQVLSALVGEIDGPAIVLTPDRHVLGKTDRAAAVFSELDVAELAGKQLIFKNKQIEACFQGLAVEPYAAQPGPGSPADPGTPPDRPAVRSVCVAGLDGVLRRFVMRQVPRPGSDASGGKWLVIHITEPRGIAEDIEEVLQEHFDLSQSEAHLARCLTMTGSMNETVRLLGITRNTAKTHLRRIYEKTGVHTQLELAGLVHRLSGLFRTSLPI